MSNSVVSAEQVTQIIKDLVSGSPENTLQGPFQEPAFAEPLVGFSSGADPLYQQYKEVVGPFHWTPSEAYALAFPDERVEAEELTVVSWVLPQTEATKADNRAMKAYPAERWARNRIFGEQYHAKLRKGVLDALKQAGVSALSPHIIPQWQRVSSDKYVFASTWSERHAAFAAGLGTFGLCDGLITPKGKAMRVGSVIARIQIEPTERPYTDHHQYCLFYSQGICGKCMTRCPVNALSENGHDKKKCVRHLHPTCEEYVRDHYKFDGYGCGLCQTGVPCESKIPTREDLEAFE